MINNPLEYILKKYNINPENKSPIFVDEGRDGLAVLFKELDYKVGAEIGVYSGMHSELLCKTIPNLELYSIDPWKKYPGYVDVRGDQGRYNRIYEQAKTRLSSYNCHLIKKMSVDAAQDISDNSLDFVCIDGNHDYEHCVEDIAVWSKKIKKGGIISGHDYRNINSSILKIHVQQAVMVWTKSYQISPWFVLNRDTKFPSWMWVKST